MNPDSARPRGILLLFYRRSRGVDRVRNLSYGPVRGHRVDLYRGSRTDVVRPVRIHLHGGGFVHDGQSREGVVMLTQLAALGWFCRSADHRLGSATWRSPRRSPPTARNCSLGSRPLPRAAPLVVFYGYPGSRTADPSSSPALLAQPDAPPMLVIHGAHDTMVPPRGIRAVAAILRQVSHRPVVFAELPHTQHSFDVFASVRARLCADVVETFPGLGPSKPL